MNLEHITHVSLLYDTAVDPAWDATILVFDTIIIVLTAMKTLSPVRECKRLNIQNSATLLFLRDGEAWFMYPI